MAPGRPWGFNCTLYFFVPINCEVCADQVRHNAVVKLQEILSTGSLATRGVHWTAIKREGDQSKFEIYLKRNLTDDEKEVLKRAVPQYHKLIPQIEPEIQLYNNFPLF